MPLAGGRWLGPLLLPCEIVGRPWPIDRAPGINAGPPETGLLGAARWGGAGNPRHRGRDLGWGTSPGLGLLVGSALEMAGLLYVGGLLLLGIPVSGWCCS
jgi:hypothetical protein